MVDCSLLDLSQISDEQRRLIFKYLDGNGRVKPKDLGITPRYMSMLRHGDVNISDSILCKLLEYLSHEELNSLLRGWVPEKRATLADALRVIITAKEDPTFREQFLALLNRYLGEYVQSMGREWHVSEGDVEAFIKAMRLKGDREKTIRDKAYYIRKALAEMDWTLSPDRIRDYLVDVLSEEGPNVARHVSTSLKAFLKHVLRPRDPSLFSMLYNSFTTIQSKASNNARLPTIEELRQILSRIESIEAKTYFLILAEAGLRPGEPFLIKMDSVDLERGMLRIEKMTRTKRAFVAFLRPETLEFIKREYLPRRETFVNGITKAITASGWFGEDVIEQFRNRFMPFDQGRLRREIKEAARQALGEEFNLYILRKFFTTWMVSHGVPESIVNTLQGRAPPSEYRVLIEHYWSPRHEELRKWYLEHAPCLLC